MVPVCTERWCTAANQTTQTPCNNPVAPTYPVWAYYAYGWQCRCQKDHVSLPSGRLEKTTRLSQHHVAQHRPIGSETTTPYHLTLSEAADLAQNGWQCRCQEDPVSFPSGGLEKTTRSSPNHVAQHRPTGSETTRPYAPRSSRFGSEPPSVEDDVDVWRNAILELHARNDDDDASHLWWDGCKFDLWLYCQSDAGR